MDTPNPSCSSVSSFPSYKDINQSSAQGYLRREGPMGTDGKISAVTDFSKLRRLLHESQELHMRMEALFPPPSRNTSGIQSDASFSRPPNTL